MDLHWKLRYGVSRAFVALFVLATVASLACSGGAPPAAETAAPFTAEQSVEWYESCWELFNNKAWDEFQNCYTEDATSESVDSGEPLATGRAAIVEAARATAAPNPDVRGDLQLILANGSHLVSVALWKGTHTAPMPGPDGESIPATGKAFGFLMAHTVELNDARNTAQADASYVDVGTMLGQLELSPAPSRKAMDAGASAPTIVIARHDEAEAENVAAFKAQIEAFNSHDVEALAGFLADDYVMHGVPDPADENLEESLASTKELFEGFEDAKLALSRVFGAGDYTVAVGTFEGTNTGDVPAMGIEKTGKHVSTRFLEICRFENGKIVEDWLFYNGAAFAAQLGAS